MSNIKRALKAKLSSKDDMPEWYHERLAKCNLCPHNSKNVENLSLEDKARIAHNLGKPACLICTCGVEDKCSDEQEQCPDSPPRWLAREVKKSAGLILKLTSGNAEITYDKAKNEHVLDYGNIPPFTNTQVELYYGDNKNVTNLHITTSCGCTTNVLDGDKVVITYRNSILGNINKTVTIVYKQDDINKVSRIQLKGRIQNGL